MPIEIRTAQTDDEFARGFESIGQYFGMNRPDAEAVARIQRRLPRDRMTIAVDGDTVVGGAGAYPFRLSVPGNEVACAGITVVGVSPTHRRRGVLRGMMVRQLTEAHQRGDPIAALWASEESIYGRFGYGLASFAQELSVRREDAGFARPFAPRGTFRFASPDEALPACQRLWAQLAAERPGVFGRSEVWWRERVFEDAPGRQEPGGGPRRCVLYELDGEVRGYAIYRHRPHLHEVVMHSDIDVLEAVGADAEATRALWRWLFDLDLAQRITAHKLPLDHPLIHLAAHPRRLQLQLGDALWVRLVDLSKALTARTYAEKHRLVFEVRDAVCPWNAGRWALEAGRAERTEDEADLAMDVDALGSAYLGGVSFRAMAEAFRVEERTRGAVELADALFRVPRLPWCPEIF